MLDVHHDREDEPREQRGNQGDAYAAETDGDTDRRRQPDPGSGGQPQHVAFVGALQDRARADEADAGGNALDDAANLADRHLQLHRHQYEHGRSQCDEHVRAQSRRFVGVLTLDADDRAGKCREDEADDDARQLLLARDRRSQLL